MIASLSCSANCLITFLSTTLAPLRQEFCTAAKFILEFHTHTHPCSSVALGSLGQEHQKSLENSVSNVNRYYITSLNESSDLRSEQLFIQDSA